MFSGLMLEKIQSWNCLMLANLFCIVGAGLTLIKSSYICLLVGRVIYGFACGNFSVFCTKYTSQVAPTKLRGVSAAFNQVALTVGFLIPYTIGLKTKASEN